MNDDGLKLCVKICFGCLGSANNSVCNLAIGR